MRKDVICMKKVINKVNIDEITRSTIECHIFEDTECFFCGLCDKVRQEKEYYDEYAEELSKSYINEGMY